MEMLMEFKVLNWNVAGAKFLEKPEKEREEFREELNNELERLIRRNSPDVVTLQEIVKYGENEEDIFRTIKGYEYHPFPLIDSKSLSIRAKWNRMEKFHSLYAS